MKARNINALTRRRTRRPDARTYRELRKSTGSGRRRRANVWLTIFLIAAVAGVAWVYFR